MQKSGTIKDFLKDRLCSLGFLSPCFVTSGEIPPPEGILLKKRYLELTGNYSSFVLTGLPFITWEPEDSSLPGDPRGLIAPFATRNYYAEAASLLKGVLKEMKPLFGLDPREVRIFTNSSLPEKPLAALSGLGLYGRNGLIYTEEYGSNFIIAGLAIKIDLGDRNSFRALPEADSLCGSCSLCIEACPTGAMDREKGFIKERCLQYMASEFTLLPDPLPSLWGRIIYGCTVCQEVCPKNRNKKPGIRITRGEIGPSVSLKNLLAAGKEPGAVKTFFKKTALDRRWISPSALIRNGLIACGNSGDPAAASLAEEYICSAEKIWSYHALQAVRKLKKAP